MGSVRGKVLDDSTSSVERKRLCSSCILKLFFATDGVLHGMAEGKKSLGTLNTDVNNI